MGSRYRIEVGQLDFAPKPDVRPTTSNPVMVLREDQRIVELMRWGLVPFWAKDPRAITNCFNARSENAYQEPTFRGPFKKEQTLLRAHVRLLRMDPRSWRAAQGEVSDLAQ